MPWACLFSEKGVAMEQRVVKVSLETEDSPVSWLSSSSRGQKAFRGQGLSTRLLFHVGMQPHSSLSKKLRKYSTTGQEHGMGMEVNLGKGKPRVSPRT